MKAVVTVYRMRRKICGSISPAGLDYPRFQEEAEGVRPVSVDNSDGGVRIRHSIMPISPPFPAGNRPSRIRGHIMFPLEAEDKFFHFITQETLWPQCVFKCVDSQSDSGSPGMHKDWLSDAHKIPDDVAIFTIKSKIRQLRANNL
jgi:hypothetical protein